MQHTLPLICLASVSPRRAAILDNLRLPYRVLVPETEEKHPDVLNVMDIVKENSLAKARSVRAQLKTHEIAIGADTLVVQGNEVLGKPKDRIDAERMLRLLSGRSHTVMTGLALFSRQFGERAAVVSSSVHFKLMSDGDIQNYLSTKEPYDKAGAYGIQGLAAIFIERVEGSYTNVMGLPVETLLTELAHLTRIPVYRWFQ